jgi:hypothetical protein
LNSGAVDCTAEDAETLNVLNKGIDYLNTAVSEIRSLGGLS